MTNSSTPPLTALALQGGGVHGAFAWGVVDRLLEDGLVPSAICGVSSGALIATGLAQGWALNGATGSVATDRHRPHDESGPQRPA